MNTQQKVAEVKEIEQKVAELEKQVQTLANRLVVEVQQSRCSRWSSTGLDEINRRLDEIIDQLIGCRRSLENLTK